MKIFVKIIQKLHEWPNTISSTVKFRMRLPSHVVLRSCRAWAPQFCTATDWFTTEKQPKKSSQPIPRNDWSDSKQQQSNQLCNVPKYQQLACIWERNLQENQSKRKRLLCCLCVSSWQKAISKSSFTSSATAPLTLNAKLLPLNGWNLKPTLAGGAGGICFGVPL